MRHPHPSVGDDLSQYEPGGPAKSVRPGKLRRTISVAEVRSDADGYRLQSATPVWRGRPAQSGIGRRPDDHPGLSDLGFQGKARNR
jgi:hypothetical protein